MFVIGCYDDLLEDDPPICALRSGVIVPFASAAVRSE